MYRGSASPITFTFMVLTFPTDIARKVWFLTNRDRNILLKIVCVCAFGLLDVHPAQLILPIPGTVICPSGAIVYCTLSSESPQTSIII